jgi:membrane-associated phospholipid phosphatase
MPSLHAAFPLACALIGWHAFGRVVGTALLMYAAAAMTAVMYLGDHYAVDVVAGAALAAAAVSVSGRVPATEWSLRRSVAMSGSAVALTCILLVITR